MSFLDHFYGIDPVIWQTWNHDTATIVTVCVFARLYIRIDNPHDTNPYSYYFRWKLLSFNSISESAVYNKLKEIAFLITNEMIAYIMRM